MRSLHVILLKDRAFFQHLVLSHTRRKYLEYIPYSEFKPIDNTSATSSTRQDRYSFKKLLLNHYSKGKKLLRPGEIGGAFPSIQHLH